MSSHPSLGQAPTLGDVVGTLAGVGSHKLVGASVTNMLNIPWKEANLSSDFRAKFALNTCDGCHGPETGTLGFVHIGAAVTGGRSAGAQAALSGFLTGVTITDPVDGTTQRTFGDLARRKTDFAALLDGTTSAAVAPLSFIQGH